MEALTVCASLVYPLCFYDYAVPYRTGERRRNSCVYLEATSANGSTTVNRVPWQRSLSSVVSLTMAFVVWGPASRASADDPAFVGWSAVLPPLAMAYEPSSSDDCVAGRVTCVKKTIREMQARFDPLAQRCDHSAVFALAYLRTTESYLEATQTSGFFNDPAAVNHEDAAFAQMYFNAYDDWNAGYLSRIPPAWRVALQAAKDHAVSGSGDLLLGMNAHVNRDLPFVLVATGMVGPGAQRKQDHDHVNVVLNHVVDPLIVEEAARFDPDIARISTPYEVGYTGVLQLLVAWRENAWRQAERLATAPDAASRDRVAAQIEAAAEAQAQAILTQEAYRPPLTTSVARDDYCAASKGSGY